MKNTYKSILQEMSERTLKSDTLEARRAIVCSSSTDGMCFGRPARNGGCGQRRAYGGGKMSC